MAPITRDVFGSVKGALPPAYTLITTVALTRLDPVGADQAALVALLTQNTWPFHVRHHLTREQAEECIDDGAWGDEDHRTLRIDHEVHGRVVVVRLEDLTSPPPLFDLRVAEAFRG